MAVEKKYELWIQNVKDVELKNELVEIQKNESEKYERFFIKVLLEGPRSALPPNNDGIASASLFKTVLPVLLVASLFVNSKPSNAFAIL